MRADIVPGGTFPDYELPDHTNVTRRLSELQGDDPLILTLARGHYCPKEHQQHLELAAFYPKIAVAYTQVATIATDEHHTLQEFRASVGAPWPFLSDPVASSNRDLDIQEYTDPEHDPMIPHTLVLKPGLVVHPRLQRLLVLGPSSVVDLWHDLRACTREIRPDWDLEHARAAGGLGPGDRSAFHGWDRRAAVGPLELARSVPPTLPGPAPGRCRRTPEPLRGHRCHSATKTRRLPEAVAASCPAARCCTPGRRRARRRRARRSPARCRRRRRQPLVVGPQTSRTTVERAGRPDSRT